MNARIDPATVVGWGVDADPENDPTFPMRDRSGEGPATGLDWPRPPLQRSNVEVLLSIEHDRMPAVYGTTVPPSGLSGMIRRAAFRYSESQWAHWLLLMLADRVNMVEGVLVDFAKLRPPNLVKEYGLKAEWKHNRAGVLSVGTVAVVGVAGVAAFLLWRERD